MHRHKYKVTFTAGLSYEFESQYHISNMNAMPTPKGSYVHFSDCGVLLDLGQLKKIEIDGIEYKMLPYLI